MEHEHSANEPFRYEVDSLLYPSQAFSHPREVVDDPDLTLSEKRSILASWASDARAVEAAPNLRKIRGSTVRLDEILEALRELDVLARSRAASWARRRLQRAAMERAHGQRA